MKKRSLSLIAALGLIASLAVATPSQANSITYFSSVVANQDVPFSVSGLTLPMFNMPGQILTGVTLSVDATIDGDVEIYNASASTLAFTNAFVSIPVTVTGPNGVTASTTATANVPSGTANPGINSFAGAVGTSTGLQAVPPGMIMMYVGAGTFNVTLGSTAADATSGGTGGGGQLFFGGTAMAGGTADVTYTYMAAVPEPASMGLLGIGMAGFFAFRRFFDKRAAKV
jgi:hypothetical protein